MSYNMKPGSKEKNTEGTFSQKSNDTIAKTTMGKMSRAFQTAQKNDSLSRAGSARAERIVNERLNNPPNSTDSLAVYMRNNNGASVWGRVANAAEKRYGKIDVSGFDPTKPRKTNAAAAFKKYKL